MSTKELEFDVTGMSCGHCENAVKEEISLLSGVHAIQVSASKGELKVEFETEDEANAESVISAVAEAGYQAKQRS